MNTTIVSLEEVGKIAFNFEKKRKQLLDYGFYKKTLATYREQKTFLPDENTADFWDDHFKDNPPTFPMEQWRISTVIRVLNLTESWLNVGVGRGILESQVSKEPEFIPTNYLGSDITNKTLQTLKLKFPKLRFVKSTLENLSTIQKSKFKQVLLLEVLEHIKPSETFKVLNQIHTLLENKGKLIISVPLNEGLEEMFPYNPNSHMRVYSEALLRFELEVSGFKILKIYRASAFNKLFFVKHILNSLLSIKAPNNIVVLCQKR